MNRSAFFLLALVVTFTLTIPAGAVGEKTGGINPSTDLHDITILYANDVRGETEPCG
jgi:hypothetical protein